MDIDVKEQASVMWVFPGLVVGTGDPRRCRDAPEHWRAWRTIERG